MIDKISDAPPKALIFEDLSHLNGPFDIVGDVHGCFDELYELIKKLGYKIYKIEDSYKVSHSQNRKLVFVGDLVDRGPKISEVLKLVMDMAESNIAHCVKGNHDDKLKRKLLGRDVKVIHGLEQSLEQLELESTGFKEEVIEFLNNLKAYLIFDTGKLIVSHAGFQERFTGQESKRVEAFCLYGQNTGEYDEYGLPIRYDWAKDYKGNSFIVYGHTPMSEAKIVNNTINIDTGCVFGGALTAFRYPEKTVLSQRAFKQYRQANRGL